VIGFLMIVVSTVHCVLTEIRYHKEYGKDWVREFEKYNGSLSHANLKIAIGISSLIAIGLILVWFYRQQSVNNSPKLKHRRRH